MRRMLAATAFALASSEGDAAETPSDAQMVENQITTCRLVMEHEGLTSGSMRLCMAILFIYSKDREGDSCRVFLPVNASAEDMQNCVETLKAAQTQKGIGGGKP
jgi:hypothetical protein